MLGLHFTTNSSLPSNLVSSHKKPEEPFPKKKNKKPEEPPFLISKSMRY